MKREDIVDVVHKLKYKFTVSDVLRALGVSDTSGQPCESVCAYVKEMEDTNEICKIGETLLRIQEERIYVPTPLFSVC